MDLTTRGVLIALGSVIAVSGAVLFWAHRDSAAPMDFIERHLGFSPDDGDGSMEVMLLTVLVMIIATAGFRQSGHQKMSANDPKRTSKLATPTQELVCAPA